MKKLLIDDMRNITADYTARTFDAGLSALKNKYWEVLYLDHDLGEENPKKTGYDILCWLETNPKHLPGKIELVTSNPVGYGKMEKLIAQLYDDNLIRARIVVKNIYKIIDSMCRALNNNRSEKILKNLADKAIIALKSAFLELDLFLTGKNHNRKKDEELFKKLFYNYESTQITLSDNKSIFWLRVNFIETEKQIYLDSEDVRLSIKWEKLKSVVL